MHHYKVRIELAIVIVTREDDAVNHWCPIGTVIYKYTEDVNIEHQNSHGSHNICEFVCETSLLCRNFLLYLPMSVLYIRMFLLSTRIVFFSIVRIPLKQRFNFFFAFALSMSGAIYI